MTASPVSAKIKHKDFARRGPQKHKAKIRSLLSFLLVTREAYILSKLTQALQAPAGSTFRKALIWGAGTGFSIIILGLVVGVIPPPKHVLADSSRIVSIYYDGQKKVITTDTSTVGSVLEQSGVKLEAGDLVEPAANTAIPVGFYNINVYRSRPVVVKDGDKQVTVQTALKSPRLIAEAAGLTVYPEDTYDLNVIDDLASTETVGQEVVVHRAVSLNLAADGQNSTVRTQQKTVGGLLNERDVALGPQDTVQPGSSTPISPGMTVSINRVKVAVVKETEVIPRDTQTLKDANLDAGSTQTRTEGSDGSKETSYRVNYQNGVEQARVLIGTKVVQEPVAKVVVEGTKINLSADPVTLGKQLAAQRGWTGTQWDALYKLWDRESGWNPNSKNFWSGACGIPQAMPCSKIPDHSTAGQIRWGLSYIAGKYGTPAAAWAHWQANHSY